MRTLNKWLLVSHGDKDCAIFAANSFDGSEKTIGEVVRTSKIMSLDFVSRIVKTEKEEYLLGTPAF